MDDRIYVIYFDGKRYVKRGLKIAYLTEGAAKQVITVEAKDITQYEYEGDRWDLSRTEFRYWYNLSKDVQSVLIEETKKRFEIIEYKPCKEG